MLKAIQIENAAIGAITSRADHSVAFRIQTPELLASQAGELCMWHGRACRVTIEPHDTVPDEAVIVDTAMGDKSPSTRWRGVLYVAFQQGVDKRDGEDFDSFYRRQYAKLIEFWKAKLNP